MKITIKIKKLYNTHYTNYDVVKVVTYFAVLKKYF